MCSNRSGRRSGLRDADEVARGVAERAIARAPRLGRRLLEHLGTQRTDLLERGIEIVGAEDPSPQRPLRHKRQEGVTSPRAAPAQQLLAISSTPSTSVVINPGSTATQVGLRPHGCGRQRRVDLGQHFAHVREVDAGVGVFALASPLPCRRPQHVHHVNQSRQNAPGQVNPDQRHRDRPGARRRPEGTADVIVSPTLRATPRNVRHLDNGLGNSRRRRTRQGGNRQRDRPARRHSPPWLTSRHAPSHVDNAVREYCCPLRSEVDGL